MLNYRWGWKTERKPPDDYFVLIYNIYRLPPDICCRFVIRGTFYYLINAVCKFFNKKSVQIVEANSHISG